MDEDYKYPRGHAYIRMRNKGYRIDVDFPAARIDVETVIRVQFRRERVARLDAERNLRIVRRLAA